MSQTYSHIFKFETENSQQKDYLLNNILAISNKDDNKYVVEYLQYDIVDGNTSILYRHKKLIVDRLYFLETANITVDDRLRREKFFSVLGKRRFSANNNQVDFYLLNEQLDTKSILNDFKEYKQNTTIQTYYYKSIDYSENHYKMVPFKSQYGYFIFLKQNNISPRKTIKKYFVLELDVTDFSHFLQLNTAEQKVEYYFNKIGKIQFKSLEPDRCKYEGEHTLMQLLSYPNDIQTYNNELSNDYLYKELKDGLKIIEKTGMEVYASTFEMIDNTNNLSIEKFCTSCIAFTISIKNISAFEELNSYITAIVSFAQEGKLSYLLQKNDSDLHDMFIYTLDLFLQWMTLVVKETTDHKLLQRQHIDLNNALKHLISSYLEFNHSYQIKDAQEELIKNDAHEIEVLGPKKVSASEFFNEIELDIEIIDELSELEEEVRNITLSPTFDIQTRDGLVRFFEGYSRMLNFFFEFKDLGYSLIILSTKLKNYETKYTKDEMLLVLLLALVEDLISWKENVLISKTADWIHYMDSSFYSNISQMEMLLNNTENEESELEFF